MQRPLTWPLAALALVLGLCLVAVNGCGGSKRVTASGRLTYKGKPVPSTRVTFMPQEEGLRASHGTTDDEGKFTLKYSSTAQGVLRGQHTVFLTYEVSADEEMRKIPPKASAELKAVIAKYADLKTSPLHYELTTNGQIIEINLD